MDQLKTFTSSIKGLTRNPLGIVGLFISLIYGFACLVLGTSISNLEGSPERLPLIWFIITFPVVILAAFIYLVINHHEKLYAPSDFRDDNAFIETLSGRKIKERQEKEVELLESAEDQTEVLPKGKGDDEEIENKKSEIETVDVQQARTLNKTEIEKRLINSEKWAIKELELKFNLPFRINQRLVSNSIRLELDAYGSNPKKVVVAEVKYWDSSRSLKPLLHSIQKFVLQYNLLKRAFANKELEVVVIIVFDKIIDSYVNEIKTFVEDINENVQMEFKQYSELEKEYQEEDEHIK